MLCLEEIFVIRCNSYLRSKQHPQWFFSVSCKKKKPNKIHKDEAEFRWTLEEPHIKIASWSTASCHGHGMAFMV